MNLRRLVPLFLLLIGLPHDAAGSEIRILPRQIALQGRAAIQRLILERLEGGENVGDLTRSAEWRSSDPHVVRIERQLALPVGNGTAMITATTDDGITASARVEVTGMDEPAVWEFRRHVLPVVSRSGCNTGACHGALAGKGGFKLSLNGYHPAGDYQSITRAARGRRVELADPGRSLILTKPTTTVRHKGGRRIDPDSREYRVLAGWISAGAEGPSDSDSQLVSVDVLPDSVRLKQGDQQQLIVSAKYSDGRQEDVTQWSKFSSSDETVAKVDDDGQLTVIGHGDGAIVVWFSSQIVLSRLSVPFANQVAQEVYQEADRRNFIDDHVLEKLSQLNIEPSPRANDSEFLRRAFLDTIGLLPTAAETEAFLNDSREDKRDRLIEHLLTRPEFNDYWAHRWSDLLLVNGRRLRPDALKAYYNWIREQVADNAPWDQMVRDVVTATGSSIEEGATNFYALHQDPENMTENVSQAFLGLSIGCAKCHNHPLEKWTNDQYYAMANFFSRVKAKGWGGDARNGDGVRTIFIASQGDLIQPLTGVAQRPTPLDGEPLPLDHTGDRREYLADWLTSPQNSYFGRAIANRVWAAYFGQGIVQPVDDMRVSNPARNEPLLAALSDYLVEHRFDLKSLMREILQSETYQRSSGTLPSNEADRHFFSRYFPRRLSAEVLLDAIAQVSEVPTEFNQIAYDGADFEKTEDYPLGTRAIQLHDSAVVSRFLTTFGRNERDITCDCERSNTPSMVQVLHINNGVTINERLRADGSCVKTAIADELPTEQVIRQAFLSALARQPTQDELERLVDVFQQASEGERSTVIEDLYWGIMSTREFLFNH